MRIIIVEMITRFDDGILEGSHNCENDSLLDFFDDFMPKKANG